MTTFTERTISTEAYEACSHGTCTYTAITTATTEYAACSVDTESYTSRATVTKAFPSDGTSVITHDTPPIISNIHANYIGTNSAILDWDTDELANCRVFYSTQSVTMGAMTSLTLHEHYIVNSRSYPVTNLTPDTTYYFYVESGDVYGNVAYSGRYYFKTADTGKFSEPPTEIED